VSGSTWVACWLVELVNGSWLILSRATFAEAAGPQIRAMTEAVTSAKKRRERCMEFPRAPDVKGPTQSRITAAVKQSSVWRP